jgi:hypothetical protein
MRNIGYKSVKSAVAVAACVALAAPVPAFASPAASTSSGAAAAASAPALTSVAVAPRPNRLTAALLSTRDLRGAYQIMAGGGAMSMMGDISTDANICDQQFGQSSGVHSTQAAGVAFTKNGGPMLFEALAVTGSRAARRIVAGVATAPRRCPSVLTNIPTSGQQVRLAITPLRVPRLGDAAAGLAFTVRLPNIGLLVHGKMISVAVNGVAVTIMLIGVPQTTPQEANAIAMTAVRKLQRQQ